MKLGTLVYFIHNPNRRIGSIVADKDINGSPLVLENGDPACYVCWFNDWDDTWGRAKLETPVIYGFSELKEAA